MRTTPTYNERYTEMDVRVRVCNEAHHNEDLSESGRQSMLVWDTMSAATTRRHCSFWEIECFVLIVFDCIVMLCVLFE